MPQKMPKMSVFAVEKMMAGGKPSALTNSVKRKLNTTAQPPNDWMYSAVSAMSPRASRPQRCGKKAGFARWMTSTRRTMAAAAPAFTMPMEAFGRFRRFEMFGTEDKAPDPFTKLFLWIQYQFIMGIS